MNTNQNTRKTVSEADFNLLKKADDIHTRDNANLDLIHEFCEDGYLQRQLAEECCELAQAALKLIRAWKGESPVTEDKAMDAYIEELADVWVMLSTALQELDNDEMLRCAAITDYKRDRLHERLCKAATPQQGGTAKAVEDDTESPSEGQIEAVDEDEDEDDVWDDLDAAWAGMDEALTQITAEHMEQKRNRASDKADKDEWKEVMDFVRRVCDANRAAADRLRTVLDGE